LPQPSGGRPARERTLAGVLADGDWLLRVDSQIDIVLHDSVGFVWFPENTTASLNLHSNDPGVSP
jgi:hypothetical protein